MTHPAETKADLDEFELGALADFVGENWTCFVGFMEGLDITEAQCEELVNKLEKAAGRN